MPLGIICYLLKWSLLIVIYNREWLMNRDEKDCLCTFGLWENMNYQIISSYLNYRLDFSQQELPMESREER
ncbi:hypothetical protein Pint_07395 [Pistacia integerrima]|uniref:Uncharacterized protein n=1 Tax=Pistacia integerrima TaxID=434235 RepID=A0ACC0XWU4_9ROSI|nr:hypothetical protein Pint_07395 [Pistacia integerrima]